jgi:hypothetical protein
MQERVNVTRTRATDLIQALQELVSQHGDETEVAVAINLSRPLRQEVAGLAVDREIRQDDEPDLTGPPLVWLITIAPDDDTNPYAPRRACIPRVFP